MIALAIQALFAAAGSVAIGTIAATIVPYRARIACLLIHGSQYRETGR